ncbi:hypothetical protein GCM10022255_108550 [Dactylosporangium darangshiense]|uniref:Thiamine-binding protein domain-containing protein n=2 Tax=Dactylosporangium darangshiense TaxID=579108 RepID=A0ABP8DUA2_9ACTN
MRGGHPDLVARVAYGPGQSVQARRFDAVVVGDQDSHGQETSVEGMSVLVAFSVTPLGGGADVGELVAEAVRVVRASGLPNRTDAMFTTVEGESWEEVMGVVQAAVAVVQGRSARTSTVIKVDWRDGPVGRLESKVASVERHLAG